MSFFHELKRRNVFRVGIAYLAVAWLLLQIADVVLGNTTAPNWVFHVLILFLAIGLPIAVIFAWAFEMTPEGLRRERDVDDSGSTPKHTGRMLDRVIIGLLAIVVVYFAADRWLGSNSTDTGDVPVVPIERSIAVLPFSNRSSLADDVHFVNGMYDDILTRISKLSSLDKVISRTSSERYRESAKPLIQIGQELGVATILEGGVQRAGDRVRINMQLINAATDEHLWAETYDYELTIENLFAMQSDIAAEVARALDAVLSAEDKERLESIPTANINAYNNYVLGRQEMTERTANALSAALAYFERSVELDPEYALAYVGIADVIALQSDYAGETLEETLEPRRAAIDKALELDPLLGEAFAALGLLQQELGDTVAAEASYLKAIELSPNYATAYHWYSLLLSFDHERREESLQMIRVALSLDPAAPILTSHLANVLRSFGRIEEAQTALVDGARRNPEFPSFYENMAYLHQEQGRIGDAAAWMDEAVRLNPLNFISRRSQCSYQVGFDDPSAAQECLENLRQDFPDYPESSFVRLVTDIYFLSGQPRAAVDYHLAQVSSAAPEQSQESAASAKIWLASVYIRNAEWPKARPILEEIFPHYFTEDEVAVSQQEVGLAVLTAASMCSSEGCSQRARYLAGQALATMRSMHRTGGIGYGINDVAAHAIRGDVERILVVLREAIDDNWRENWWTLREPAFRTLLEEEELKPEWEALISELEADIAKQRRWYEDHKDDPLF